MTQLKIINGTYREPTEQQKGMELSLLATGGSTMEEGILKTLEMQRNLESRLQAAPRHTPALAPNTHTETDTTYYLASWASRVAGLAAAVGSQGRWRMSTRR